MQRKRLAVFISGRGSNMEAIWRATQDDSYPAEIAIVISDNEDAAGLETAVDADIAAFAFERKDYASKADHEAAIIETIDENNIDLICLAGYMRLLSGDFTQRYANTLINIHPSLLPKHKGLDTHERAIKAGDKIHGCTVHYVSEEMDGGEIIAQAEVPVLNDDTPDTLAARVLVEEHKLYPSTIAKLCTD